MSALYYAPKGIYPCILWMQYNSNPPLQVHGETKLSVVSFRATRNYFPVLTLYTVAVFLDTRNGFLNLEC